MKLVDFNNQIIPGFKLNNCFMEIDHVHFYVDNAIQWRDWFVHFLGFQAIATSSDNATCTAVVNSKSADFVLSSPLTPESPVAKFLQKHPPGVSDS